MSHRPKQSLQEKELHNYTLFLLDRLQPGKPFPAAMELRYSYYVKASFNNER